MEWKQPPLAWAPRATWIPEVIGVPHILDAHTREPLAVCHTTPGEPKEWAWSRACIMSMAPELHVALAEMIIHAKRHLPEELLPEVKKAEDVLNKVKELYDRR